MNMESPLIILLVLFSVAAARGNTRDERELHPDDKILIDGIRKQLNKLQESLQNRHWFSNESVSVKIGSVYTRWGQSECHKSSELMYKLKAVSIQTVTLQDSYMCVCVTGTAGGSHHNHDGGAANTLCLPMNPEWGKHQDGYQVSTAYIYGAEYETDYSNSPYRSNNGYGIPCAVCRTRGRTSVFMIPARKTCNKGWTEEYNGYLMAGYLYHKSATEYLCMDEHAKITGNGKKLGNAPNTDTRLFFSVEAACGTLPCSTYIKGRELTCVVCSM